MKSKGTQGSWRRAMAKKVKCNMDSPVYLGNGKRYLSYDDMSDILSSDLSSDQIDEITTLFDDMELEILDLDQRSQKII